LNHFFGRTEKFEFVPFKESGNYMVLKSCNKVFNQNNPRQILETIINI